MPVTYTYNDAIRDAQAEVVQAWEAAFDSSAPENQMKLMLDIIGRLDQLKRPARRKRLPQST